MKNFLFAIVTALVLCSTAVAGPFGIFGNRQTQQSNCPGGNCQIQRSASSSFTQTVTSVPRYNLTAPVPQIEVPKAVAVQLVKEVEVMPKTLTINGILYTRH